MSRPIRRHKWLSAAVAAVFLLIVIGLIAYNRQLLRAQRLTTEQLLETRAALRTLLAVSGESLAGVPNSEQKRADLALVVLERYQRLGEKFPDDSGVQLETAQVHRVLGGIFRITSAIAKSQASYNKAITILTKLCADYPGRTDYRRWLVETYIEIGEFYHMNGKTNDAEKDFQAAIAHSDKLLSVTISPTHLRLKAMADLNLSEILLLKGEHAEARKSADQAVDLLNSLTGSSAESSFADGDKWLLSMAVENRGAASEAAGAHDDASYDYDFAERVIVDVGRASEVFDDAQYEIARIANARAELLAKTLSRLPEAQKNYDRAAEVLDRLIYDHASIAHYKEELAVTLCGRAAVHLAMRNVPAAQRDCRIARDQLPRLIEERARTGTRRTPTF